MEEIKSWAFSVCVASICGAIFNMLLPEGNLQKTLKCVISIYFLSVVISPFSEIVSFDFSKENIINIDKYSEYYDENEFDDITEASLEEKITEETKKILSEKEIDSGDIFIKVNISDENSINITKFTVILSGCENPDALKDEMKHRIGIEPEIILSGENKNGNSQ